MRLTTSALVLGAASAAVGFEAQQPLGKTKDIPHTPLLDVESQDSESWIKPLEKLFGEFTSEAKSVWDDVATLMPGALDAVKDAIVDQKAKEHTRKPDSAWDHVVKGAEVQGMWVQNENGESERHVGGRLENYNLRAKKVDPESLGVDKVKQYSGYLDDDEKDKHLFYCKETPSTCIKPR